MELVTQPEAKLTTKIIEALRKRGAWAMKKHGSMYSKGQPDILCCYLGCFVGFEVKRPGREGTLTVLQAATLDAIIKAGGTASVVSSVDQALDVLDSVNYRVGDYEDG